ncbi:MAG: TetR/AcrR family transcriptional regulator [Pseudoclavibacter sp.]
MTGTDAAIADDSVGATVSERLIAGGLSLIAAGEEEPSVRRLAEASGRSTMCVYTHFGGRQSLIRSVHERAAARFLDAVDAADDPVDGARTWLQGHPGVGLWMFAPTRQDDLRVDRDTLIAAARARVGAALDALVGAIVLRTSA